MNRLLKTGGAALAASCALLFAGLGQAADEAQLELGKALFTTDAKPMACAICHTLKDAGSSGNIGPDLDDLQPEHDAILAVLRDGSGPMPSFEDDLSPEEMEAVAAYVLSVTSGN